MYRYKVSYDHSGAYWHIYDREILGECSIPGHPLKWRVLDRNVHGPHGEGAKEQALAWLHHCYATWGGIPLVGGDKIAWERRRPFKSVPTDAFGNVLTSDG
ncbi:hypothetical protein ABZY06_33750 [Streptomyces sp. NPDC006540]|uniref:hypothetical protein n=1 Tax=Streptomyces sp. NPDC006540 TaxID=3155353 RepID=UPI00339E9E57